MFLGSFFPKTDRRFSMFFSGGFVERRIPGKNGEGTPGMSLGFAKPLTAGTSRGSGNWMDEIRSHSFETMGN